MVRVSREEFITSLGLSKSRDSESPSWEYADGVTHNPTGKIVGGN